MRLIYTAATLILPLIASANPLPTTTLAADIFADNGPTQTMLEAFTKKKKPTVEPHIPIDSEEFVTYMAMIIGLVLLAGVFAGLTIGLMGLDRTNLMVLSETGSPSQRKNAPIVLDLLNSGRHTLLVALLLANTLVNTSLPIFLDQVVGGGVIAILASTGLIVVFGEIIPQSVCARWGLPIGAACAPFVKFFTYLLFPLAKPIAMLLDWVLGEDHGTHYTKHQIKEFLTLGASGVEQEISIIGAILELGEKTVDAVMTPMADVYTLSSDTIIDDRIVAEILANGYSRVPIHTPGSPTDFLGLMLIKKLLAYDPEDALEAASFVTNQLPQCGLDMSLLEALEYFQNGRSHMLLVSKMPGENSGALGVVTLEDVIEEMLGKEIIDETDVYVDVHSKIKVVRQKPTLRAHRTPGLTKIFEGVIERRKLKTGGKTIPVLYSSPTIKSREAPMPPMLLDLDASPEPTTVGLVRAHNLIDTSNMEAEEAARANGSGSV